MNPFDSFAENLRALVATFDEVFVPNVIGGPAFNGRGNVTDAEVARRRAHNKTARRSRRKNRR